MNAIRSDGVRTWLETRAEAPAPAPGEALIRTRWAAVSPLDAALPARGGSPTEPLTLGHQFVGTVESLGADADRDLRKRWEGRRVVGAIDIVCSQCDLCRAGLASHCRNRRTLGMRGWDGCLSTHFKLPLRNLVEVPSGVDDQAAVFAFLLSGAIHAAQLVRVEGKPYVTILGDTAEALLCAQVMARLNASVRLLGKRQFALCEKWGIKHRDQSEVGRRHDQDIVVDCTSGGWGLSLAMQLARPRGKIVLRPGSTGPAPEGMDLSPIVDAELQVLGAGYGSIADAIAMLARGEIDTLPLITKRAKLADGPQAVALARATDQITVLIEP